MPTYTTPAYSAGVNSYGYRQSDSYQPRYSSGSRTYGHVRRSSYGNSSYQTSPYRNSSYRNSSYRNSSYRNSTYGQARSSYPLSDFRNLNTASPGYYTTWRTASGTSRNGYLAADGSRWTLMQNTGRVHVDGSGNRHRLSDETGSQLAWKIERDGAPSRSAWIARDEKTGSLSILYRRPQITDDTRFYPATVKLDGGKVTAVSWRIKPEWADQAGIVKGHSTPSLPVASYRPTTQGYVRASQSDLLAARQAIQQSYAGSTSVRPMNAQQTRPYDSVPQPTTVPAVQKDSSLSLTVSE
ncbi:MAG: hypothetical protein NXI04_25055 [Planctomycetaceae bacterium]|nr:hypothetical protein [Planctomycetaceae bacterium]